MSSLTTLLSGGSAAGAIDHRKEALPLFGMWGDNSDQNHNVNYRIFDSGFKNVGSPWGAVCNSTTNYRFGMLADASHAYTENDHGTHVSHHDLTTQSYSSWTYWNKSMYQCDQYPHAQFYTSSRDGFVSWHSYHEYSSSFEYQNGWNKLNMVLPEGIRPRRMFVNRRNTLRERYPGNHGAPNIDEYDYSSNRTEASNTYATGTGYNEKTKTLVMVHSGDEGGNTSKTIHIFKSSKCLNKIDKIKEFFDNLTSTEHFTDTWTNQNVKDWCVVVGNNDYVGFGLKQSNSKRYGVFDCSVKGGSAHQTGASRQWSTWQDFTGSTTTSYGAASGHQYYTKFMTTWDGTWGLIYSPYYYYGCGINAFCMNIENPRKFICINQTKSSRSNPYFAWGRTGFHGGWSDNCDSTSHRTYSWCMDPTDSDETINTTVYQGGDSGDTVVPNSNAHVGTTVTNKTGNYGLSAHRTWLHGGFHSTNYPLLMQIDWWGSYGQNDSTYGGKYGT